MNTIKRLFRFLYLAILISGLVALILVISLIVYLEKNLPDLETLRSISMQVPLKIYSSDGKLIAEFGEIRRSPVTLDEVPPQLINAILATEDHRFYQHNGVDLKGIARAAITLMSTGNKEQGGSTITMQVARNFFLSRHKTFARKINEILLALKIEQQLTKDEILSLYLNKIYMGKHAYGISAAAEVYYGKKIDELTLAQMAMLAGLPQAPSNINPLNNPVLAKKRRQHVLSRLLMYKFITQEEYNQADSAPLTAKYFPREIELEAPYVAEMVRQYIIDKYGEEAYGLGINVYTTINSKFQIAANNALARGLLEYTERHAYQPQKNIIQSPYLTAAKIVEIDHNNNLKLITIEDNKTIILPKKQWHYIYNKETFKVFKSTELEDSLAIDSLIYIRRDQNNDWKLAQVPTVEGAIVAEDPNTGAILALTGGFDFNKSPFNRATQAMRQPGSVFKPFIYTAALIKGFSPASIINDAPITEETQWDDDWRPQNHTKKFYGPTRLRVGLVTSRNLVSIRLLREIGIDHAIKVAKLFGFREEQLPHGLSLALGTCSVSPLELTNAYAAFANGGYYVTPFFIEAITDFHNNDIYKDDLKKLNQKKTQIISPQIAFQMQSMLKDTIQSGTGRKAKILNRDDLAGKSGSTNDHKDAWFTGFNESIVISTWIGYDDSKNLHEYSASAALPMWIYFMQEALAEIPKKTKIPPPGIVAVKIDPTTGLLAHENQQNALIEMFRTDQVPVKTAPLNAKSENNNYNNTSETGDALSQELF